MARKSHRQETKKTSAIATMGIPIARKLKSLRPALSLSAANRAKLIGDVAISRTWIFPLSRSALRVGQSFSRISGIWDSDQWHYLKEKVLPISEIKKG